MEKIEIELPNDLKELASESKINWQMLVERKVREELEEISNVKKILQKSKLTEEQAEELSDEVNKSLSKRYNQILNEKQD